jgi:hypothetical protein
MEHSTSVFNAIYDFSINDEYCLWVVPKDSSLRGKPIQLPIKGGGILTWVKSPHCQVSDEELKSIWENYLKTGNPTPFLNAVQSPYLSQDLVEALFLSCYRKVKWELWPDISTNKDSLTSIIFKNPFTKNGELCVILPQNFISPDAHSLLTYSRTLFESIMKNCKTKESINPKRVKLFDAVLREAYPVSEIAKEKCEGKDSVGFLSKYIGFLHSSLTIQDD